MEWNRFRATNQNCYSTIQQKELCLSFWAGVIVGLCMGIIIMSFNIEQPLIYVLKQMCYSTYIGEGGGGIAFHRLGTLKVQQLKKYYTFEYLCVMDMWWHSIHPFKKSCFHFSISTVSIWIKKTFSRWPWIWLLCVHGSATVETL